MIKLLLNTDKQNKKSSGDSNDVEARNYIWGLYHKDNSDKWIKQILNKILCELMQPQRRQRVQICDCKSLKRSIWSHHFKGFKKTKVKGSEKGWTGDTVGTVAMSSSGKIAVASSTGGVRGRPVGRVGDTPLWGSGFYCDENIGILATGVGEAITEQLMCYRVAQYNNNL